MDGWVMMGHDGSWMDGMWEAYGRIHARVFVVPSGPRKVSLTYIPEGVGVGMCGPIT